MVRRLLMVIWLLACLGGVSSLSGEEEDAQGVVRQRVDLSSYRAGDAPLGPRLSVPADLVELLESPHSVEIWNVDAFESGTWAPFASPGLADRVVSADQVAELLRAALPFSDAEREQVQLVVSGGGITVQASADALKSVQELVPWVLASLAPSLRVDAVLESIGTEGERRLRALGGGRLWPNRWMRVYLQENAVPCVVHWDIEVAQESTTMDPFTVPVPEGQELYLRYHPGESVSVVELWAGSVEHLEIVERDLSAIRNIPEANGPGVLSFPRSAVHRLYTAYVLPTDGATRREVTWRSAGGTAQLRLSFEGPRFPSQRPLSRESRAALLALRVGALGNALEFEARSRRTDQWVDRLREQLDRDLRAGGAASDGGRSGISTLGDPSLLLLEAPLERMEGLRALLTDAERGVQEREIVLETCRVPEAAFRAALDAGDVRVGHALSDAVRAAWNTAGAATAEMVVTRAMVGIPVGFRMGVSVPGILDFDAELAQASAGLHPNTSARFAGLRGEVRLLPSALRVRGSIDWASPEAGSIELVYRTPVSMKGLAEGTRTSGGATRRARMPVLGGGSAPVDAHVLLAGGDDAKLRHVVFATVRGAEVLVLLATVR